MTNTEQKVYDTLNEMGIGYTKYDHPPVFTVEEAEAYWADIEGTHVKNLFLRDKKGKRHFLVVLRYDKTLDIKELEKKIGVDRLSFASENRLEKFLGLSKGAVSVFGIINDTEKKVEVVVDKDLSRGETVGFHPNVNTATITISVEDFQKFLKERGNRIKYIEL